MYRMLYNDSFLFDPFDETRIVSSASITTNVNAASYLDFTIAATHPLYDTIEQRSGIITLYSDNEKLFQGQITSIDMDMDGNKSVTCSSALDWLKDVQLRPYSTDQAECDEYEFKLDKAPDALDAYFQWLIDQYNAQNKDGRYFTINVNQAADLTNRNIVYFASTSPRSVADAIEDDILKTFGGYLVLRYEDDQLILDLYSDIHEMNEQIIDYGENILDISRNESTDDQYTAVYPIGATPQYTTEQQQYHDEKDAYDEYMKQREATEKAAIENLKKEEAAEQAEINKLKEAERAEQNRINGITDKAAKKAAREALAKRKKQRQARENALKERKEQRQAHEKAFGDETKRLQDAQKIKDDENAADKTKPNPITIESLDNGGYPGDLDIFKEGDVVYSVSHVARYGYKEFVYSENDVHDKTELLVLAVAKLKTLMAPTLTIDVRAVDQALYNPKHRHLFAGQAVRVRSKVHNVDEFMMVSAIDLDLIDPSKTTATLGVAYDTLTGQQSSFLRNLNSQIVASVDAVDKLGEDVKVTEITLGKVETVVENTNNKADLVINTVDDYKWMTDTAWGKADDAQESADDAQESADEANQGVTDTNVRIDNIKMETDERIDGMETDISGINTEISNTKAEIVTIKENAEQIRQEAQTGIQEAKDKAEDVRTEANTAIDGVKTDLEATEAKAELARKNASTALGGLSSANAQINGLRIDVNRHQDNITNINGDIVGVKDTISGVAETANSALTVATTNTNAINEQSTRIDTAYSDIEATRTSVSEVKQTADGLKVNLETNYLDKDALGANYASKAELTATSESITSTVEKTYATKSALEGLQNIADAAIETWSGRAVPTASNPPASTWTTNALKRQHSGDIYYDMTTGKSYRWGSEDGTVYSWSMIADSDITKAIADAAKAQDTADGAKQDVVNLSNDVKATYTSKSELKQTSDEIKASVKEVASANETNTRKIAEVSVKADGISAKVEEQAETISGHTTTIGQLSVKADGLQTKFEQVSDDLGHVRGSIPGLINPNFTDGDYGWIHNGASFRISTYDASLNGPYLVGENFSENGTYELINKGLLSLAPGHKYRISILMHVSTDILRDNRLSLRFIKTYSPYVDYPNTVAFINAADITDNQFITYSREITCPDKVTQGYFRLAAITKAGSNSYISVKSVDIVDITEGSAALTKTSELEQNLDGFRQTVTESYLKKGDAETKYTSKSEFTQTANEIRGKVEEQATTIDGHTSTISTLRQKADKFETDITQVTEQATAIAGRTTKLEQDLGGFKQTVSGTYITKTDAEQNLVDAINGMQIGGTNMLLDTQQFGQSNPNNVTSGKLININAATGVGDSNLQNTKYSAGFKWRGIPSSNTTNNPDGARYSVFVKKGGTYTLSFESMATSDFYVYFYGPNGYVKVVKTIVDGEVVPNTSNGDGMAEFKKSDGVWVRHTVTWVLGNNGSSLEKYVLFRRKGSSGYVTILAPKLEEGSKATEWSPSPFDTLYASNIEKNYAPKTMVQQTEDRITQTAEAKYATKTQLSDEMRQSLKTLELRGRQDGNYWLKIGRVTMAQQGKDFHIDYTGGRGFNGDTSQNAQLEIHVRSSNGGGRLFAVTLNRLLNADMHTVKAFAIDSTHIDLYMTGGGQYSTGTMAYYGQYTDFSGAAQIEDISTAEGTELTVLEQSLSTKSYVDQTAESVSIGVVEDFKDGKHGDKLTTQSNLTALKDEINASVSEQYADLSDQIKLANSDNAVGKNFSFESNKFEGWASHDNWTIGWNGAHTGRYYAQNTIPANSNGKQLISMGSIAAEYGHTYKLEYWAKKKKPNTQCRGAHRISYKRSGVWEDMPSDVATTIFLDDEGKTNITGGRDYFDVTDSWMKVTTYIIPPSNVTDIRVRIIGNNPGSAETVFAVDDVSLTDYSVAKTINKTMAGINVKADSIVQEVRNDYATKDLVNRSIPGLKNPNFDVQKDGDYHTITGWSVLGPWAETRLGNSAPVSSSEGGTYFIGKSGTTAGQTLELINQGYISAYPGMKVQISWWMFVDSNIIQNSNFSAGIIANNVVTRNLLNNYSTGGWKYMTTTVEVPANVNQFRVRFGFVTTGTSGWLRMDSVSVTDVTEAKAAMGKANTAVSTLDEFTRTVKNSYVTNDKLTEVQTKWKQTTDGFEANISSISKSIPVVDPGFESNGDGWRTCRIGNTLVEDNISLSGGIISNVLGNNTKSLYISVNQTRVSNSGRIIAGDNNILMVSGRFCAINSNGGAVSGVTVTPGLLGRHNSVPYTGTQQTSSSGWTTFRVPMKVYAGTYSVLFTFGNLGGNRIVLDDINLENNTEGASARKDIDDLNTRIAMTSEGVRVGKIVNNKFQGGNVLMNANDGSFDILNGDEARNRFTSHSIDLIKNDSGYQFSIKPFTRTGTGTVITELKGVNLISQGVFALNSIPATPATVSIPINSGDGKLPADKIPSWQMNNIKNSYYQRVTIPFQASAKAYHDQFYANLDNGIPPSIEVFQYPVFRVAAIDGETTVSNRTLMITAPGLYAIQGQFNAQKPSSNAICDVILKAKKYNESDYVEIAFPYRFSEVSDPIGWTTKASQTFYVYLDAGTRIIWQYVMSGGTFTIGGGNNFTVTRMPFSGIDMR